MLSEEEQAQADAAQKEKEREANDFSEFMDDGKEEAIDPKKTYTVAGNSFALIAGGDGNTITENCKVLNQITNEHFYKTYVKYIEDCLKGKIPASKYSKTQGRIIIK